MTRTAATLSGVRVGVLAGALAGVLGLVVIVIGTFLPWLKSGSVTRNSYQAGGAMRRLLDVPGWLGAALTAWPFVGLACAGVVVLFAAGLVRPSAVLGLLLGAFAAAVSAGALAVRGSGLVAPEAPGPVVTVVGATALITASTVLLLLPQRPARPHRS